MLTALCEQSDTLKINILLSLPKYLNYTNTSSSIKKEYKS
jgi:hypothetical protein